MLRQGNEYVLLFLRRHITCRELNYLMLALAVSLVCVAPAYGDDVTWDFENGNNHGFTLWSVNPATPAFDDPTTAGDEALTGVGGPKGLPDAGVVWSIGRPDQYDGQKPTVSEGDKAKADGTMEYNQSGKNHPFTFPVNNRGQESYLNTYNLTEWGDNVHAFADQGVNLTNMNTIGLGLGDRNNPVTGGSGMVFFDDIRLYRPAP